MPYCAIEDIKKLLPEADLVQLTDDEGAGSVHPGRVKEAIAQADADIDSYLSAKYTVPLSPAPAVVRKLSVDIAVYNLYSRRLEKIPETRSERYKNAVRMLEGIAKGTIAIGAATAPTAASDAGGPEATRAADERTFTKTTLEGY
jgi:phage gp36-like protein